MKTTGNGSGGSTRAGAIKFRTIGLGARGRRLAGGLVFCLVCCGSAAARSDFFLQSGRPDTPAPASTPEPLLVRPPLMADPEQPWEELPGPHSDLVYSAAYTAAPYSELGSSVTVITASELKARKIQTVAEALQSVPGLDVVTSGGPGQPALAYIRGAASRHTLVLLNGVELNDPIAPGRVADLSSVTVDNVDRIEIVRGPQSAVYGSGGLAGIVNIITCKPSAGWEGAIGLEGGKYHTWTGKISSSGAVGPWGLALGASSNQTRGFSAAKRELSHPQPLPDMLPNAYRNFTGDASLGYQALSNLALRLQTRFSQGSIQPDNGPGDYGDAQNYWTNYSQVQARLEADLDLWRKLWQQQFSLAVNQGDRASANDQGMPGEALSSRYQARHIAVDWKNRLRNLVLGAAYRQDQGMYHDDSYGLYGMNPDLPERSEHIVGLFLENRFHWSALTMDASVRWDLHDQYGSRTTYRLTPAYLVSQTNTRLKGNYGTGFKAPSLDQLYSDFGNTGLHPETSRGWEAGVEQTVSREQASLGITYFQTDFDNQISSDPMTWRYRNLGRVQTKGWEAFAVWQAVKALNLKISYTKLTANDLTLEDAVGAQTLPKAADYQVKLTADYRLAAFHGSIQAARIGPRYDMYAPWPRSLLAPYTLVNLVAGWDIMPEASAYVKINNLLDADYAEAVGYNTARFAVYGGVEIKWP